MKILITGVAGFIGSHAALVLLKRGDDVVGIDNLNDYYDVSLKTARLKRIEDCQGKGEFKFLKLDLADKEGIYQLFAEEKPDKIINLAAQAGVLDDAVMDTLALLK